MKPRIVTALSALFLSATVAVQSAEACARRIEPLPIPPAEPQFAGDSPYAAIMKPIRLTQFERNGTRYWRAVYELVRRKNPPPPVAIWTSRTIIEWSCDASYEGRDSCGGLAPEVLPGFGEDGRPAQVYVQLDLRWNHNSSFDGTPVFYASRDGARVLEAPPVYAQPRLLQLEDHRAEKAG